MYQGDVQRPEPLLTERDPSFRQIFHWPMRVARSVRHLFLTSDDIGRFCPMRTIAAVHSCLRHATRMAAAANIDQRPLAGTEEQTVCKYRQLGNKGPVSVMRYLGGSGIRTIKDHVFLHPGLVYI